MFCWLFFVAICLCLCIWRSYSLHSLQTDCVWESPFQSKFCAVNTILEQWQNQSADPLELAWKQTWSLGLMRPPLCFNAQRHWYKTVSVYGPKPGIVLVMEQVKHPCPSRSVLDQAQSQWALELRSYCNIPEARASKVNVMQWSYSLVPLKLC
jgi:hypothetical protein